MTRKTYRTDALVGKHYVRTLAGWPGSMHENSKVWSRSHSKVESNEH